MADKIRIRRGELADLPNLTDSELGWAKDVSNLYIGDDTLGNILLNPIKHSVDAYYIDGYLIPAVDNSHGLGSPSLRWNNIVVGPGSIHIRSLPGEIGAGEKNWNIGIDDAGRLSFSSDGYTAYSITSTGAESVSGTVFSASDGSASLPAYSFTSGGAAGLYQSGTNEISISTSSLQRFVIDSSGNVGVGLSTPNEVLTINGVISLQKTTAPSATDGYGKLYVQSDGGLYYKNSSGVQTNLLDGVLSEQGADGYIAFFTGPNAIAGDNDFSYNRATGNVTIGGGGSLSVNNQIVAESLSVYDQVVVGRGTPSNPAITFGNNPDTGLYLTNTNVMRIVVDGAVHVDFDGSVTSLANTSIFDLSGARVRNSSGVLNLGTSASTSHSLSANADVIVGGKLEIDGDAYLDSAVVISGNADVSGNLEVAGEIHNTQLQNKLDGYALSTIENAHWVEGVGQRQDIRDALDGYGQLTASEGADGYIAFFISSNVIAGDNDLFYNRSTGDVTIGSGGSLSVTKVKNSSGVLNLGTSASTSHSLSANADVIVGGKLEIDGDAYLDSAVDIAGNTGISGTLEVDGYTWLNGGFGTTADSGVSGAFNVYGSSYFYSQMFVLSPSGNEYAIQRASISDGAMYAISNVDSQANNNLIITTISNSTKDHNHSLSSDPTILIHSNTDPDIDDTQWLSLSHNQTDGYISSGTGAIEIGSNLGIDRSPSIYKLEVQGAAAKTDGGTSWATISDITEKKDIVRLSELYDPLNRLTKLSSVVYKWKTPAEHGVTEEENILKAGFIAQEVEKYFPEWVKEDNLGKKWLNMVGFEAYVVESIKQIKNLFYEYNNRLIVLEEKLKK